LCGSTCGQPARLKHHDSLIAEPVRIEQGDRDDGGLAGTGWSDKDRRVSIDERGLELVEGIEDR